VETTLRNAPYVEVVLEIESTDTHQFYIVVTVEHISALENFFQHVRCTSGVELRATRMQIRSGWYFFGTKSLDSQYIPPPIHITRTHQHIALSAEDLKVLEVFASSPNGVRTQVARTLGMPLMTLQYRIERLERLGVLRGVRYVVSACALNYRRFRCLIVANTPLGSQRLQLYEWARNHPYVVSMMYGVGNWHYELRIESPDQAAAEHLVSELVSTFADFIHYSDLVPIGSLLKFAPHPDYTAFEASRTDFSREYVSPSQLVG
jgi:DNA-binding Lrp family transcriptional regulator